MPLPDSLTAMTTGGCPFTFSVMFLSIGFPNSQNFKLSRFHTRYWNPVCEGVDDFCYDWVGENNRPFCRYGGHFDFYCFKRHYGMLRGQINMYLPPGHPIIAI